MRGAPQVSADLTYSNTARARLVPGAWAGVRRMRASQGPYAARGSWDHGQDGLTGEFNLNKSLNLILETRKNKYALLHVLDLN